MHTALPPTLTLMMTHSHLASVVTQLVIVTAAVALWHCSLSARCTASALASALSGGSDVVREVLALFLASMAASATPGRRGRQEEGKLGGCSRAGGRDGSSDGCSGIEGGGGGGSSPGWGWTAAIARGWAASVAPELAVAAIAMLSMLLSCTLFVVLPAAVPCAR